MADKLRLLIDMNISPLTVEALRAAGWDVVRVNEVLPGSSPDKDIIEWAATHDYVVVTQDLDFSALLATKNLGKPSLITLRLKDTSPNSVTRRLVEILPSIQDDLHSGWCAIVVDEYTVRIRKLPFQQ